MEGKPLPATPRHPSRALLLCLLTTREHGGCHSQGLEKRRLCPGKDEGHAPSKPSRSVPARG